MKVVLLAFLILSFVSGAYATDIQLTWTPPTQYENGQELTQIDGYRLYYAIDNTVQDNIEIPADSTDYLLVDVPSGSHTFQISAIANGLEGTPSDPVNVDVEKRRPVKIELTVRVIEE